nr:MAG TPA: hypothetical protein [Caudoviricetes sp.]
MHFLVFICVILKIAPIFADVIRSKTAVRHKI